MKKVEKIRKYDGRVFNIGGRLSVDKDYMIMTIVYVIAFIVFPLIIKQIQELSDIMFILLLIFNPLLVLIISIVFSKRSFDYVVGFIPMLVFTITLILFLNQTAWVYVVGYFMIAILGNYIGYILKNK